MWRGSKPVALHARAVNVAILILLLLELASGLGGFLIGSSDGRWMFWLHRAGGLALVVLLAWKAGIAHGFPLRLVAAQHRGYDWVKWVAEVEASSEPGWLEPPLPLR